MNSFLIVGVLERRYIDKLMLTLSIVLLTVLHEAHSTEILVPSNINFKRLQLLDKPLKDHKDGLMKVYVLVKGEALKTGELLLTSTKFLRDVSVDNFRQLLLDKIKETQRFDVYNHDNTGTLDQSSIQVEARIVVPTQTIENLVLAHKAITRVPVSVNITDSETGKVLLAKTITGYYGTEKGEGTVIVSDGDRNKSETQESLYKDYVQALGDALEEVAAYLESKYRPVGRVTEVDGKDFAMDGGSAHGFEGNDQVVVFRTKFRSNNGERIPGIMKGLVYAKCTSVTEKTSTCQITKSAEQNTQIQEGDYVVVSDESLKH